MSSPGSLGGLAVLLAAGASLAPCVGVAGAGSSDCARGGAALRAMLASEYAFADAAQSSVRGAFLAYLAEDALVLNPGPTPGRPVYQAAPDSKNKLEWYPSVGEVAPSGDLGFTSGPWIYTSAATGVRAVGHFVTVWKRDSSCHWRVQFDGGVSHAAAARDEPRMTPEQVPKIAGRAPSAKLTAADAPAHAIEEFAATAERDGLDAGIRTYALDEKFSFFTDEQFPAAVGTANAYASAHPVSGRWQESARGKSADSTLLYSVGELMSGEKIPTQAYLEIWQYDPKVANWGLRLLLVTALPPPKEK